VEIGRLGNNNDDYGILIRSKTGRTIFNAGGNERFDGAFIANATIGRAQIQNASITNAKIQDLRAEKITGGTIAVNGSILIGGSGPGFMRMSRNPDRILVNDGTRNRVWFGEVTNGNYGVVIDGPNGQRMLDSRSPKGLDGTYIKDLTVDTLQINNNAITQVNRRSGGFTTSSYGGGTRRVVRIYYNVQGPVFGRARIRFNFNDSYYNWTCFIKIDGRTVDYKSGRVGTTDDDWAELNAAGIVLNGAIELWITLNNYNESCNFWFESTVNKR
jgi:hypothetical protein